MLFLIYSLLILSGAPLSAQGSYTAMTYNIRYDNPNDGENWWQKRKGDFLALMQYYQPDIFGVQEALYHQVKTLDSAMIHHEYVGVGRDDGKKKGEYSALFYRSDKFNLLNQGTFWLSRTPDIPSKDWDAALERICTYAQLETKGDQKIFWVFNTHFDHIGQIAREESAKLIVEKIKNLIEPGDPVILMGDFNLEPHEKAIENIREYLQDSHSVTLTDAYGPQGTFNSFNKDHELDRRIDYIFVNDQLEVESYRVIDDRYDLKYPSDHLPVVIRWHFDN